MKRESKVILGLNAGARPIVPNKHFTDSSKHQIIQEFLSRGCTKKEIWKKYMGNETEHGHLLRWMRKLGYVNQTMGRSANFASMAKKEATKGEEEDSFENLQLKKRISELEKQLSDAEMKAIAFSTMVDIAEKEFNIPIRKKYNTKPLKS